MKLKISAKEFSKPLFLSHEHKDKPFYLANLLFLLSVLVPLSFFFRKNSLLYEKSMEIIANMSAIVKCVTSSKRQNKTREFALIDRLENR